MNNISKVEKLLSEFCWEIVSKLSILPEEGVPAYSPNYVTNCMLNKLNQVRFEFSERDIKLLEHTIHDTIRQNTELLKEDMIRAGLLPTDENLKSYYPDLF